MNRYTRTESVIRNSTIHVDWIRSIEWELKSVGGTPYKFYVSHGWWWSGFEENALNK